MDDNSEEQKKPEHNLKVWKVRKEELKQHKSIWDREVDIDIKINPKKVLKGITFILILTMVFYLGRWSIDVNAVGGEDSSEPGFLTGLFSIFTGGEDVNETEPADVPPEGDATSLSDGENTDSLSDEETNGTEESILEEENNEEIITSYSKISFAIKGVRIDWKDTWGKITHLEYTIKNNEEGTVKPDHFLMVVEGYEDFEKKVPLSHVSREIKSKISISSASPVPDGFAYSELTAGELGNVDITITLYDASGKLMASEYKKGFDLSG